MPNIEGPRTIVVNPAAGRGRGAERLRRFVAGNALSEWTWVDTSASGDAARISQELAARGGIVAAAGGDGTISEVAAGLAGSDTRLAVLPIGTGNDFARSLGIGASLERAFQAIQSGEVRRIDMIRWRVGAESGLGVNVSGCGFDAVVAQRINEGFRNLRGTSAYLAAVVGCLGSYRPAQLRLTIDGETIETTMMLCAIANAQSYGGGMRVAPGALMDDGLLDIVVVEGLGKLDFLRAFPSVFQGRHVTHPRVRVLRGQSVRIEANPPLPVLSDGELIGMTPVEFEVVPMTLSVMFPQRGLST